MQKFLKAVTLAGFALALVLTVLGLAAMWLPALDMINDGLPFLVAGCIVVLVLVYLTGFRAIVVPAAILLALNATVLGAAWQGRAPEAPAGAKRVLRVACYNVWADNPNPAAAAPWLLKQDADAIVLEEVSSGTKPLIDALKPHYPHQLGKDYIVVLSKYPILSNSSINRAGMQPWNSLIMRAATLDVHGAQVQILGVHLARPYYGDLQQHDVGAIARYVIEHPGPLILLGDFNMTPWTHTLRALAGLTQLGRFNTLQSTWPMQHRGYALIPLFPIDNVFASRSLAKIDLKVGPNLGSDHAPVVADIAVAAPVSQ